MGLLNYLLKDKPILKWLNHKNLYLLGLATVACGLGWSQALMSIGQFIVIGNWLIELNFPTKLKRLKESKLVWVLVSLFVLHLIGLIWTEDISYALKDIRIKLPLIVLPLMVVSSDKIEKQEWKTLLLVYASCIVILSFASLAKLLGLFGYEIIDKRQLSIYVSHIRYGLNIAFAALLLIYFSPIYSKWKTICLIIAAWLIACLFLFQLYTGLVAFLLIVLVYSLKFLFSKIKNTRVREIGIISIVFAIGLGVFYVYQVKKEFDKKVELSYDQNDQSEQFTPGGEKYWGEFDDPRIENGVYVRRFVAWKEIEREWNKRSEVEFWQPDKKGQTLDQTLNRYLSSKGLKKDSAGIAQLSDEEIKAIEKGVANVYYLSHNPIQNRIHRTFFELEEYKKTGNASGFSLAMRIEFWKTAKNIISENTVFGVGTGDIKTAFQESYEQSNSKLDQQYRRRAHNQYLTFLATFGIVGLLIFLFSLVYPLFSAIPNKAIYLIFWGIVCLSFLTEDTLETQAGVTFFAFFNSILLLGLDQISFGEKDNAAASA